MEGIKIAYFDDLIRKVMDKISRWANMYLFFSKKLVLIRHVLSSIPLHLFHVLRPFVSVVHHLERLFTWFL